MWTEAKNKRRCDLIDKKHSGGISEREKAELEALQAEMIREREKSVGNAIAKAQEYLDDMKRKL